MKKLYFLASTLFVSAGLMAQTVIYSASELADFEAMSIVDADGDGQAWFVADFTGSQNPAFDAQGEVLGSFSWDPETQAPLTPDNWVVTPPIDLTGYESVSLSWARGSVDPDWPEENYSVYVVTAADLTAAVVAFSTATPIYTETIAVGGTMVVRTEDLSDFDDTENVYIGFRHHDCSDWFLLILDDIVVTGTESSTSGLANYALNLSAYPNPASDVLNISIAEPMSTIAIVGMDGRTVLNTTVSGSETTVDVSSLLPGVYYYTIATENGNVVRNSFVKK
jgi:hypothetical protein